MAFSQPRPLPQLARETSLCSAIEDLRYTSTPFQDPFSSDMEGFAKKYLEDGSEPTSDTDQPAATSEGTGGRTAPRSRWTTHERSLFLATVATLTNTLDASHLSSAQDARSLAETVASVIATRSAREVQSHARTEVRKLRARAESKSVSARIKTLLRLSIA